jgi:Flp pilus assembly protein TadG
MMTAMRKHKAGQSIVLLAVGFLFLFGLLAIGVDGGMLYVDRRQLQNVADAGALAGAYALEALPLPTYSPAHQKALQTMVDNLPGTSMPGITPTTASFTQSLGANYSVTVNATGGTGWDQYQVTITHADQLQLAKVLGFGTINLSATATARSGTYPFAFILLQGNPYADAPGYDNLNPGGNAAVQIQKASGATAGGGGFSNEGFNVGTGGGAALTFSPCGAAGDLWAYQENATSGINLAGATTGQQGDPGCPTGSHPLTYPKSATSQLPFPSYPEPLASSTVYSSNITPSGTYWLCPGTYSGQIKITNGNTLILAPGIYRFTGAAFGPNSGSTGITGGTLRSAVSGDYIPAPTGTFINCPGTPAAPTDNDYGVILEFAPASCTTAYFNMTGSGFVDLYPSAKYNHISFYVERDGGASWHSVCPFSAASPAGMAGTRVINMAGGTGYSIRGAIYAPADNITLTGSGTGYGVGQLIVWTANVSGNGTIKENYDPAYLPYFRGLIQ